MKTKFWFNGQWSDRFSLDLGSNWAKFGECLFTTLRFGAQKVIYKQQHTKRLVDGAYAYWGVDNLNPAINEALTAIEKLKEGGKARINLFQNGKEIQLVAQVDTGLITTPLELCCKTVEVQKSAHFPSSFKLPDYGRARYLLKLAQKEEYEEILFYNESQKLCECATSNIFALVGDTWITPRLSGQVLKGITRDVLLNDFRSSDFVFSEGDILLQDLTKVRALVTTNCVHGVVPVAKVNNISINTELSRELSGQYKKSIQ